MFILWIKDNIIFNKVCEISSSCNIFVKAVDVIFKTHKEIGALGEKMAAEYLKRHGFSIIDQNVSRKIGEIDIIARNGDVLHFVEVKTMLTDVFLNEKETKDVYDPSVNLHETKIRKVTRMGEWYVLEQDWEGEWQVDACLVWIRRSDGIGKVRYLPQIA